VKEKILSWAIGVPPVSLTATKSPSPAPSTTAVYVVRGSSVLLGFSVAVLGVAVRVPAV
jgi:hypothetical protein